MRYVLALVCVILIVSGGHGRKQKPSRDSRPGDKHGQSRDQHRGQSRSEPTSGHQTRHSGKYDSSGERKHGGSHRADDDVRKFIARESSDSEYHGASWNHHRRNDHSSHHRHGGMQQEHKRQNISHHHHHHNSSSSFEHRKNKVPHMRGTHNNSHNELPNRYNCSQGQRQQSHRCYNSSHVFPGHDSTHSHKNHSHGGHNSSHVNTTHSDSSNWTSPHLWSKEHDFINANRTYNFSKDVDDKYARPLNISDRLKVDNTPHSLSPFGGNDTHYSAPGSNHGHLSSFGNDSVHSSRDSLAAPPVENAKQNNGSGIRNSELFLKSGSNFERARNDSYIIQDPNYHYSPAFDPPRNQNQNIGWNVPNQPLQQNGGYFQQLGGNVPNQPFQQSGGYLQPLGGNIPNQPFQQNGGYFQQLGGNVPNQPFQQSGGYFQPPQFQSGNNYPSQYPSNPEWYAQPNYGSSNGNNLLGNVGSGANKVGLVVGAIAAEVGKQIVAAEIRDGIRDWMNKYTTSKALNSRITLKEASSSSSEVSTTDTTDTDIYGSTEPNSFTEIGLSTERSLLRTNSTAST